jgi:hypothetical protein
MIIDEIELMDKVLLEIGKSGMQNKPVDTDYRIKVIFLEFKSQLT